MKSIEKAINLKSQLDKLRPLSKEAEVAVMQKFRLEWNFHSNSIEGNTLSYGETKALILFGITAQGKPLKDHFEISGHDEALKWIIEIVNEDRPLSETFIRQLHQLILKEPYEVDAITPDGKQTKKKIKIGQYKDTPNHVKTKTGEIFRFASVEETPAMMTSLVDWYKSRIEQKDFNPIIIATQFHYKFISIHPFDDGNGRTARILMNFILMQNGYPPVIIKTEDKAKYISVLQQADAGIIEPFISFISDNLSDSIELMIKAANGESIEEPEDIDKEISILEEKLKTKNQPIKFSKSKKTVLNIFDNSLVPLLNAFTEKAQRFEKFYFENEFTIRYNNKEYNKSNLDDLRPLVDEKTGSLSLIYSYKFFNHTDYKAFNYDSEIHFYFNNIKYNVNNKSDKVKIEKRYSQNLSSTEINDLINSELRNHKDFIESQIED